MSEEKETREAAAAGSSAPDPGDGGKNRQVKEDEGSGRPHGESGEDGETAESPADASGSGESRKDDKGAEGTVVGPEGADSPENKKDEGRAKAGSGDDRRRRSGDRDDTGVEKYWVPRTKLGTLVRDGKLTTIEQVLDSGLVLREPEIVDVLLGEMQDEVIDVNMVQRMTDSGRRVRFAVTVAVGNENGYLGVGRAHGKEVGPTIRKAIDNAKVNIISLKRGCGSWECGCGTPHSIPFKTCGKSGSVQVTFLPAPKGVGLAAGDVAKKILKLGGIKDLWATTRGQTQTTWNYASAVYSALINLSRMRVNQRQQEKFKILTGGIEE